MDNEMHKDTMRLADLIGEGFSDEAMAVARKQMESLAYDLLERIEYDLRDEMLGRLAGHAAEMARKAIEAILEGDEKRMRTYLGLDGFNGRTDGYNPSGKQKEHPVIHGNFFEQGSIKLRRDIVNAHPELLKNERILDLEDQVRSLVEQVNKKQGEIDRLHMHNRSMYG